MSPSGPKPVSPSDLMAMIVDGGELALLDLSEEGTFGDGHLLFAVPMPLSRLEMIVDDLVPRRGVAIVLCAGGDGAEAESGEHRHRSGALLRGSVAQLPVLMSNSE